MIKTFHHKNPKTIWMDIAWHYMVNKKLCLGLSISSMSVILACAGSPTVFRGFPKVSQVRNTCLLLIPSPRGPTRPKASHLSLSRSHCTGRAWNDLGLTCIKTITFRKIKSQETSICAFLHNNNKQLWMETFGSSYCVFVLQETKDKELLVRC